MQTIEEKLDLILCFLFTQKEVLTVNDLSLLTGYSKSFIYKAAASRELPHSSPRHGRLFFDRQAINSWLLSNPVPTKREIEQTAINYLNK